MGLKELPLWLKGGLIGIIIGLIFFSLYNICGFVPNISTPKSNSVCQSVSLISMPNFLIYGKFVLPRVNSAYDLNLQSGTPSEGLILASEIEKSNIILGEVVLFISYIVIYFLTGLLLGLIIQKIKSKK